MHSDPNCFALVNGERCSCPREASLKRHPLGCGALGQENWPGLAKFIEEAGEALQIAGKILAFGGAIDHPSGYHTMDKLEEELADVMAAVKFVIDRNGLDGRKIKRRAKKKNALFGVWHENETWTTWKPGDEVPTFQP
jgi:NTP pyrophosphatase (non-canonical NTP hydrolase)